MERSDWNNFWEKVRILYEQEDGNRLAFDSEGEILGEILKEIAEELKDIYSFVEPLGRGGAAIVIRLRDVRLNLDRALKVPRPKEETLIETVRAESNYLTSITHENIIGVYFLGEAKVKNYPLTVPYFVMDYIPGAKDIRKDVLERLKEAKGAKDLTFITKWIADKFYKIADAIKYLHQKEIIHFDIKPSNILIGQNGKPILSDLGFAKKKEKKEENVVVGFTLFYAHKNLKQEYGHMSSKNRVRKKMAAKDFMFQFDIYALGKSMLEILALVDSEFPDSVLYDYNFVYLHLAACRMLDGYNLSDLEIQRIREKHLQDGTEVSVYKETWIEFDQTAFNEIKYASADDIGRDLRKLLTGPSFLESVEELNEFYTKKVQCADGTPASFSERVKLVVEHPSFSRLSSVAQLGLLSSTYPSASHNRLEHSLGVFRNCCLYVRTLYNDPHSPLFKQLATEEDIKCLLLGSLLHDVGQYPLAHELEEVDRAFKHEGFTEKFLESKTKDKHGFSLKEIVENQEWGWGVPIDRIKELVGLSHKQQGLFEISSLKAKMLASVIDGPIDADKLDYLLRDSQKCHLRYGQLIDFDRLIRNLTIVILKPEDGRRTLSLGVYEKGQSAAESLTFARYLMYQTLYWHRTNRAVRVMLREALQPIISKRFEAQKAGFQNVIDELEKLIGVNDRPKEIRVGDILNFFESKLRGGNAELIQMIKGRNYFKRIVTLHDEKVDHFESGRKTLLDKFRQAFTKPGFEEKLQKKLKESLASYLDHTNVSRLSVLATERTETSLDFLENRKCILCDAPEPSPGTRDRLMILPEPKRLHKNYFYRVETGMRVSEVWHQDTTL